MDDKTIIKLDKMFYVKVLTKAEVDKRIRILLSQQDNRIAISA